jgi:hypothetical protein
MIDPTELARRALEAIAPSTSVAVSTTARVAGRPAYVLTLEPRTPATLVGRIEIDVDAEQGVPLRVAVYARDRTAPSLWAEFTSVGFGPIDPGVYRFSPPPGATVRDLASTALEATAEQGGQPMGEPQSGEVGESGEYGPAVRTFGTGWATVVAVQTPSVRDLRRAAGGIDLSQLLPLSSPLLSVRLVDRGDHGWLVYGAVPQDALAAVEARVP